jgi:hypothetical protein
VPHDPPSLSPRPSSRGYWACQLGGWGLYSVVQLAAGVFVLHLPWPRALLEVLVLNGIGLLLSHGLHAWMLRYGWEALALSRRVPRILLASALLAAPLAFLSPLASISALQGSAIFAQDLRELAPWLDIRESAALEVLHQWLNWSVLFGLWQVCYYGIIAVRRSQQAQLRQSELVRSLQQAELRLLKAQLNPHFLFNALNTVRALIAENPAGAQSAVTGFANTLRYALSAGQHETVPLARELEIVRDYLDIEALRLGERLHIEYAVAEDALTAGIPTMLLQTLVENAIKHGIAEMPGGGTVRIAAAVAEGMLQLSVSNSRPPAPAPAGAGTGLHNSAERLRLLYGAVAHIGLDLSQPQVAVASVRLPVSR